MQDKQVVSRPLAAAVVLFLMAILVGRLIMHPTPERMLILAILAPVMFFIFWAKAGFRNALVAMVFLIGLSIAVRYLLLYNSWLVLILAPFLLLSIGIAVHVVRVILAERALKQEIQGDSKGEREEE